MNSSGTMTRNPIVRTALCVLLFLLTVTPALASSARQAEQEDKLLSGGVVDVLDKGGPVMILILVGSIVAIAFAFERAVTFRNRTLLPSSLVKGIREAGADVGQVQALVDEHDNRPLARIIGAGLKRKDRGTAAVEQAMEAQGAREVARLKRPVRPIAILATVQPLLGLLGTIIGMIGTFNVLAGTSAAERVEKLAPGIGTALYTTAAGLCAAIPCVLLYHWLVGRVNKAAEEWSNVGTEFITALDADGSANG